ncbi:MAG TPA: hypothetical protein DCS85_01475, partial [Verrucomicrobiales bacterium]|nr:hypothetical protein [Verrucomicrobiales bacterium]
MLAFRTGCLLPLAWACLLLSEDAGASDFSGEIQPLLANHCYPCHGPDAKTRKRGLRFDLREVATGELESGARAIAPGDLEESELVRRIFSKDPDEMMPPPDFRKRLSDGAREKLVEWIKAGAHYEKHWAFLPVEKPAVPPAKDRDWPRNPIDNFILARLEGQKMEPSPEASRRNLVRRVSLDLRGLPPSPAELARHSTGNSEEQFARLLETMMDSPHYGER